MISIKKSNLHDSFIQPLMDTSASWRPGSIAYTISGSGRKVISNSDMTDDQKRTARWRFELNSGARGGNFHRPRNESISYRDKFDSTVLVRPGGEPMVTRH
jgi:hypothetical protein